MEQIMEQIMASLKSFHPGKKISEMLEGQSMSQKELAVRTGMTEKHISTVISGQKNISPTFAKKLEYVFDYPVENWLSLQAKYDAVLLDYEEKNHISPEEFSVLKILKEIIQYMIQLSLLKDNFTDAEKVVTLRKFLRVSSLEAIPNITYNAAYRAQVSDNVAVNVYVLYVWQYICESLAGKIKIEKALDKNLLKSKLNEIKNLMFNEPNFVLEQLEKIFAECGIAFCLVKHFRGAPVQGFIKHSDSGNIMLCMTIRQARADIFWFTLFHEIAHVLSDDADKRFVDFSSRKNEIEAKADRFARRILIDDNSYRNFLDIGDFSEVAIKKFAQAQDIQPYIIVGRLQSDEVIDWSQHSNLLVRYKWIES